MSRSPELDRAIVRLFGNDQSMEYPYGRAALAILLIALLSGGAVFGLIGVVLAVPVAATLRLVLIYVNAKLRDEDPFPRLEEELAAEGERPPVEPAPVRTLDPRPRS